jgi:hypothetical protein
MAHLSTKFFFSIAPVQCPFMKKGRPAAAWRSTVKNELDEMGLTWNEAKRVAKDREE